MWTDAQLENWRLRQRVELSTFVPGYVQGDAVKAPGARSPAPAARPIPSDGAGLSANPSPYERVQSGNGVVRLKLKPVEVVQLPDDSVDDLWR